MENQFRPLFIEPDNMMRLGFKLINDKDGYLQYENTGFVQFNTDYNKGFPESPGKVKISINTNMNNAGDSHLYLGIYQDGGTRTAFHGVCDTEIFLKLLISNIR